MAATFFPPPPLSSIMHDPDPQTVFEPLLSAGRTKVALAVSGGGDSMALLAAAYLRVRERGDIGLLALTVDHGLRPDSAAEAAAVAAFCSARGIAHRTLSWNGAKPASGISAAARAARHALLAQAALEAGTDIVLTGHTLDDQAETVAMRGLRAGGRGEAGMATATLFDNEVWFVRPLLHLRRESLREFLRAQGIGWSEDPSNTDMRYERARLRASLSEAQRNEAADRAARKGRAREAAGREAAAIIDADASRVAPGLFRIDAGFTGREKQAALYALRILLAIVGGRDHLVEDGRAADLFARLSGADRLRATLSRCVVDRRGEAIFLYREARGLPEVGIGDGALAWDGRYRIARKEPGGDELVIGPAGGEAAVRPPSDPAVPPALVRAAARTEPLVAGVSDRSGDRVPRPEAASIVPLLSPWARHLPLFDLAAASAAARLTGAPEIPPSPLARHNRVT